MLGVRGNEEPSSTTENCPIITTTREAAIHLLRLPFVNYITLTAEIVGKVTRSKTVWTICFCGSLLQALQHCYHVERWVSWFSEWLSLVHIPRGIKTDFRNVSCLDDVYGVLVAKTVLGYGSNTCRPISWTFYLRTISLSISLFFFSDLTTKWHNFLVVALPKGTSHTFHDRPRWHED